MALSVVIGIALFGERIARSFGRASLAIASLAVLAAGLAVLARSPLADDTGVREMDIR